MRIVANGAIEQTRSRRDRLQTAAARNEEWEGNESGHPVVPLLKQRAEKSKQQNINILWCTLPVCQRMSIRIFGSAVPVFYIFCFVQHLSWHYCAQRALAIVAIVFPSHPAAPSARRFSSVILGSDFLSVVLDAVVLSVGKRTEKKRRKPKQNSRKTKLHFLQLENFFASRLESYNSNKSNNNNNNMGSNITGKGCVRFCVVVRFSSCCCCGLLLLLQLLSVGLLPACAHFQIIYHNFVALRVPSRIASSPFFTRSALQHVDKNVEP